MKYACQLNIFFIFAMLNICIAQSKKYYIPKASDSHLYGADVKPLAVGVNLFDMKTKYCINCKSEKETNLFRKNKNTQDGFAIYCTSCFNERYEEVHQKRYILKKKERLSVVIEDEFLKGEIWKEMIGFEGEYQVSNLGRVKSCTKHTYSLLRGIKYPRVILGRILKLSKNKDGYIELSLKKQNKSAINKKIHRSVAEAFILNSHNKPVVNHKNGIKDDNRVENLEWCTIQENVTHAVENGLWKMPDSPVLKRGKLNPKSIQVIQKNLLGDIIKIWDSMRDIERDLNIASTVISDYCKGKTLNGRGFIWEKI